MKKSKSTKKSNIKNENQAKDFVLGKMCKVLNDCLKNDIDEEFTCGLILFLTGQILLSKGEADVFESAVSQLVENNKDLFGDCETDPNDDGTFH